MTRKYSFSTLGCPTWTFDQVLSNANALGFHAIEVRGIDGEMDVRKIAEFKEDELDNTKSRLAEQKLSIVSLNTSLMLHRDDLDSENFQEALYTIDLARKLNVPFIRVFGDHIDPDLDRDKQIQRVIDGLDILARYAKGDVKILLEVHGTYNTIQNLLAVMQGVTEDGIGLIWDIEHSYREYGEDIDAFYNALKAWIWHVHVKDCIIKGDDLTLTLVGDGDINIKHILNLLEEDHYDGFYSFEWEKKWIESLQEPEIAFPAYIDYMNKTK